VFALLAVKWGFAVDQQLQRFDVKPPCLYSLESGKNIFQMKS